jgi:nucleoid DNA-binding protein
MSGREEPFMKKTELIETIAEKANAPKSEAQRFFDAFEEVVTDVLKSGDEVQITGFGKFYVREQKAREGRNPQTGEKMRIPARKVPTFSAGNSLKESV